MMSILMCRPLSHDFTYCWGPGESWAINLRWAGFGGSDKKVDVYGLLYIRFYKKLVPNLGVYRTIIRIQVHNNSKSSSNQPLLSLPAPHDLLRRADALFGATFPGPRQVEGEEEPQDEEHRQDEKHLGERELPGSA